MYHLLHTEEAPSKVFLCRIQTTPVPSVGPALGYWVKKGVGLVVHFPLEDVAKIITP
jgi:hypothetical protein